jgi:hypothetical protein
LAEEGFVSAWDSKPDLEISNISYWRCFFNLAGERIWNFEQMIPLPLPYRSIVAWLNEEEIKGREFRIDIIDTVMEMDSKYISFFTDKFLKKGQAQGRK